MNIDDVASPATSRRVAQTARSRDGLGALAAGLRDSIPGFRGSLQAEAPTSGLSWFRTGGPAEALATPADEDDLALLLADTPADVPILVVGLGSNLKPKSRP